MGRHDRKTIFSPSALVNLSSVMFTDWIGHGVLLVTGVLCGDPAPHVLGAIDDSNPFALDACEKLHRRSIDQRDVFEIEKDSTITVDCEQFA